MGFPAGSVQPTWQEAYTYDLGSRRLSKDHKRAVYAYTDEDWQYTYDGLNRVTTAKRGVHTVTSTSDTFTTATDCKTWALDELGNFQSITTFGGTSTPSTENRSHTAKNEIRQIGNLYRFYDPNGNLQIVSSDSAGVSVRQKLYFDAWNRLVRMDKLKAKGSNGGVFDTVKYTYNGLNWRATEHRLISSTAPTVTPADGVEPGGDTTRYQFYSSAWQQLMEVVANTPTNGAAPVPTSCEQQLWGLRGPDDAILRRIDGDADGTYTTAGVDKSYYQLTDSSFSVICHVDAVSGQVRQWNSYDAYGSLKVMLLADYDGDGQVTQNDEVLAAAAWYTEKNWNPNQPHPPYTTDFNGDGVVDDSDWSLFYGAWLGMQGMRIPDPVRIGYGGYVRDRATELLLARSRWYEPVAGRWVSRDPAGYVDGLDLYLYAKGNPLCLVDPTGLSGEDGGGFFDWWVSGYCELVKRDQSSATSKDLHENIRKNADAGPRNDIKDSMRGLNARRDGATTLGDQYHDLGNGTDKQKWQQVQKEAYEGAVANVWAFGGEFAGQVVGSGFRVIGEMGGESGSAGGRAFARGSKSDPAVGLYKDMKGKLPAGYQANHLNQDGAFGSVIKSEDGFCVQMKGQASSDIGSQHYKFHSAMEEFWEQYRTGSKMGERPTCGEYDTALRRALGKAGYNKDQVGVLANLAAAQRSSSKYNLTADSLVPEIPGRVNQKKK
jgi:RHS repeat-associated protein